MFSDIFEALKKIGPASGNFMADHPGILDAMEQFGGSDPNNPISQLLGGIAQGSRMGLAGRAQDRFKDLAAAQKNAPVATQDNSTMPGSEGLTPPPGMAPATPPPPVEMAQQAAGMNPPTDDGNWEMDQDNDSGLGWKRKLGSIPLRY